MLAETLAHISVFDGKSSAENLNLTKPWRFLSRKAEAMGKTAQLLYALR